MQYVYQYGTQLSLTTWLILTNVILLPAEQMIKDQDL